MNFFNTTNLLAGLYGRLVPQFQFFYFILFFLWGAAALLICKLQLFYILPSNNIQW